MNYDLISTYSEIAAEYSIVKRDSQQIRIAVLLICEAETNLMMRI